MNKQVNPLDRFITEIIEKHIYEIAIALLVLMSVVLRYKLMIFKFNGDYISGDFRNYLREWVKLYREYRYRYCSLAYSSLQ